MPCSENVCDECWLKNIKNRSDKLSQGELIMCTLCQVACFWYSVSKVTTKLVASEHRTTMNKKKQTVTATYHRKPASLMTKWMSLSVLKL